MKGRKAGVAKGLLSYVQNIRATAQLRRHKTELEDSLSHKPPELESDRTDIRQLKKAHAQEKLQFKRLLSAAADQIHKLQNRSRTLKPVDINRKEEDAGAISKKYDAQFKQLRSFFENLQKSIAEKHRLQLEDLNCRHREEVESLKKGIQLSQRQAKEEKAASQVRLRELQSRARDKQSRQIGTQSESESDFLEVKAGDTYEVRQLKLTIRRKNQLIDRLLSKLK